MRLRRIPSLEAAASNKAGRSRLELEKRLGNSKPLPVWTHSTVMPRAGPGHDLDVDLHPLAGVSLLIGLRFVRELLLRSMFTALACAGRGTGSSGGGCSPAFSACATAPAGQRPYLPAALSRSRFTTGPGCISGLPALPRISPHTSSAIAGMPCPVLYFCSCRMWPPLGLIWCGNAA